MLITGRDARALLLAHGVSDRRARHALQSGLAGMPIVTRAAHLFESERVEELGRRPLVSFGAALRLCPRGYFLWRGPLDINVDPAGLRDQLTEVPGEMSPWTALWFHLHRGQGVPLIATVAGFVVGGATIVGATGLTLDLAEPGSWFDGFAEAQLQTTKGRQWAIVWPQRLCGCC